MSCLSRGRRNPSAFKEKNVKFFSFVLAVLWCLFSFEIRAEEAVLPDTESPEDTLPADSSDAFLDEQESLEEIKPRRQLTCDDPLFVKKVAHVVEQYWQSKMAASTIARRKKALILAGVRDFEPVSAVGFSNETDVNTANVLIMMKINYKIPADRIVLCRQKGKHQRPIYVAAYPSGGAYQCQVINVDPKGGDYDNVTFVYP